MKFNVEEKRKCYNASLMEEFNSPPKPGEYVELRNTEIRDIDEDNFQIEFDFVAPVSIEMIEEMYNNRGGALYTTVLKKLSDKGWMNPDGKGILADFESDWSATEDMKTWRMTYRRN